jgi:hypothetical protein
MFTVWPLDFTSPRIKVFVLFLLAAMSLNDGAIMILDDAEE